MKRLPYLVALCLFPAVLCADFNAGKTAYLVGDYEKAYGEFEPLASSGDAKAQLALALMYETGRGVGKSLTTAEHWFRSAAEQGDATAQAHLARMYFRGSGVSQDYLEASKWYRKSAEQGRPDSQFNLGGMYEQGLGVERDYVRAYAWLAMAARGGSEDAGPYLQQMSLQMGDAAVAAAQILAVELLRKYGAQ